MGSIPESVDCYNDRRDFDSSSFDQRFYQATSMDLGGMPTLATSSYPPGNFMPVNRDPTHPDGNYGFSPREFGNLHSALMAGSEDWHAPAANYTPTAQWAAAMAHPSGLHLQTDYPPGTDGTTEQHELVSPADTMRYSSFSTETAVDPSQSSNCGSRSSTRKRSKAKAVGVDSPKKHKRSKTNPEEIVIKGSGSVQEVDLADLADLPENEGNHKREKFLARNRVAASKCRQKKKEWTNSLEDRARELSVQQNYLTTTVNMLRNELLELKCRCLEHHDCRCDQIRDYLKSTVAGLKPTMDLYNDASSLNGYTQRSSTSRVSGSTSVHSRDSPMDSSDNFGSYSASPALGRSSGQRPLSKSTGGSPSQSFAYDEDPHPQVIAGPAGPAAN